MVTFTPSSDVWTLGYDQFDNICWRNNATQELYYIPPGQPPALPPRGLVNTPRATSSNDLSSIPVATARAEVLPFPEFGEGDQFDNNSALEVPEAARVWPASVVEGPTPRPSPSVLRTEEANQWSRDRDSRGKGYYFNIITGEVQSKTPDCLKKYTCRR